MLLSCSVRPLVSCLPVLPAVCANINLFMEINDEEFEKYLQTFVTDIWHMLMQVSTHVGWLLTAANGFVQPQRGKPP